MELPVGKLPSRGPAPLWGTEAPYSSGVSSSRKS